ncbi:MAG TPA: glycosyltransferase family 4 protein [Acidimicrobiales bacterium]|nr:glycosyltransferase family 4 protein [Acidimicrobiales bacterium]
MTHLLVTNDFPPKVGGIQSYLWELWRRLPPERTVVLTTAYPGAAVWDATQPFRVVRSRHRVLLPTPATRRHIEQVAAEVDAKVVVLDPALPLGLVGPQLDRRYAVVLHGAEVTVPGRLPATRQLLRRVVAGAEHVIAAGGYPAAEARHATDDDAMPPTTVVPPGVDTDRFRPLDPDARRQARHSLGVADDEHLVVSMSRLVPRKGMDVLIDAAARLDDRLVVLIAGSGRDRARLERRAAAKRAPVRFLGRVPDDDLPTLLGAADVFAMLCRNRWAGLEQEGFGIVFLEAAACGIPQVAGDSGGAAEAVVDGETGLVVRRPADPGDVAAALHRLLGDDDLRHRMGERARRRAVTEFDYDLLAARLDAALRDLEA